MGARALFGRRVIYTDVAEINDGNIIDVLQKALFVHLQNSADIDYLYVQQKISMITTVVGGALLAVGAILALSGVALPLGLGLMAAGALSLGAVATLNWDFVVNSIKKVVSVITGILSGALIVLGVLLCLSGAGVGLGLAVLAAGLSLSYAAWTLDDNPITRFVRQMANSIIGLVNGVIDAINDASTERNHARQGYQSL